MEALIKKRIEEAAHQYIQSDAVASENMQLAFGDFINGANFALQNQWISVEEGLPPYDKEVIGMDYMPELALEQTIIFVHRSNNPNVITDKNKFCVYPPSFCKVTHWMPIPIPSLKGGEK